MALPNIVLFQGRDASGELGLWETNGTASGTFESVTGLNPSNLTVLNGKVLFESQVNGTGPFGLWTTNGTPGNATELTGITDINHQPVSNLTPNSLIVFDGQVLFNGTDSAGKAGLWTTDGTTTTELVAGTASGGLNPTDLTLFENEVLFSGVSSGGLSGLFSWNGATATQLPVANAATGGAGLNPSDITVFGAHALFAGADFEQQNWIVGD